MTTGQRLNIPGPLIRLVHASRDDLDWLILGGIHAPTGQAKLYKVLANGTWTALPAFGTAGKDDSLILKILPNGTLRAILSEALVKTDGTSDSGSTVLPTIYDFPGVFPAYVAGSGTVDAVARQQIASLTTLVNGHESRLDRIAGGAVG